MWRVVFTGERPHYENVALDRIMLDLRGEGKIPNTIRFLKFKPECVLIGFHQAVEQEVRLEYVEREGIQVGRRITGGGAIYFDETQIGWEIIADRESVGGGNFEEITAKICRGIARGLRKLGIPAQFRPRNDIEVDGRKISGTGGVFEGNAFLYQGTLLMDFNVERMLKSLQIPVEKLTSKGIKAAEDRVEWVKRYLGYLPSDEKIFSALLEGLKEELGIEYNWGHLTPEEESLLEKNKEYYRSEDWVFHIRRAPHQMQSLYGIYRCPGGTFRVSVRVDLERNILQQVNINGDFFVNPRRLVYDLEAYLKHTPLQDVKTKVEEFFSQRQWEGLNLTVNDFVEAILFPIRKAEGLQLGIDKKKLNNIIASIGDGLIENLRKAKVMLLPYCAKPRWCDYRHLDDCGECGGCTVGDAYRLAYQKGMIPITITSFELLRDTLLWCARNGYTYIGHCCYEFFEKRYEIFQRAAQEGAKGVLLDIVGTTCYSLGVEEEEKAYHGEFTVELDLLKEELYKTLKVKEDVWEKPKRQSRTFDFSPYFRDFVPTYYKKPKAVPSPEEDRTRTAVQEEVFLGEATIEDRIVSSSEALATLADWIKRAERPTLVVGPLLVWDWGEEELRQKAEALRTLIEKIPHLKVKVLPDYRPKLGKYDPSVEMDPPNPHQCVLHDRNDLTLLVGVHCYRTDFVIRLLRKHTPTRVVTLCGLYGHPTAHLSVSFTDAEKLYYLSRLL
ncbi:Lipoate--protein ligase [Thermocrinis albus DSM 14484]|uniref:Lipoate--protein ligase n=1 Tax=Thermocrinis albus (strain DSM 14484 / JCM 11386 / HI 11/12) TaxID=638303 RepID=D3SNX7_THEAH|nr:carbon monoxide dehydrogenase beta subunit family protein [Thermocrinis albus]ADC88864.1 Lipoate--protein ligase [Thermocrinis albus DSM 14484]